LNIILTESNCYYQQHIQKQEGKSCQQTISVDELYRFLALIMLMEQDVQDTIRSYWSTNKLCCTPFYSEVMKCDWFMHVMKVLHW
jgi:hypothetical protein